MKNILSITLSILLTFSFAIAQDGINYQGAATDANGDELTNQNITIRASVLSATANGNLQWEETHSATTDQFGLFNVVIGQGTNTANGAIASFDDMDWGSGNHFLKIEMDATGGTNYAMIGTTQMMSVPYALYAKSAGNTIWEKDSVNNISYQNGNVNIGTNTNDSSAVLNINSVSQGVMLPSMTEAQRDAISSPTTGLLVFQNDGTNGFYYYNGTQWTLIGAAEFDPTLIYTADGF
jgi:hypothetical protein